ncbi:pentapeptide repeat-containing protein [Actinosynnema sp. NPDC050436]|uniref:pentapeptide repeat-containing protein n=1 Tax=Actinosynnema sp. NPDC050436 TaxID=3155659 RepID=UPI003407D47F
MRPTRLRRQAGRRTSRPASGRTWNWTAVASLLAAVAAVAGVVFTGLSLQATRAQNAVTEQGQLTDRFTRAVDQLDRVGPEHLQARLGAIYALERLARDSPRDHPTVVEVLSAFVRSTAPQVKITDLGTAERCPDQQPAVDVQAALTVLGRRNADHDHTAHVDLRRTCLVHADLTGANLATANLINADLTDADLPGANLTGATLVGAKLNEANLSRANAVNVDLRGTQLAHAILLAADLRGAQLTSATLYDAHVAQANLTNANLAQASLFDTNLTTANLTGADLSGANLDRADLTGANLSGANLTDARHGEETNVSGVVVTAGTTGVWWR